MNGFEDGKFVENSSAQAVENLDFNYHLKVNSFDF